MKKVVILSGYSRSGKTTFLDVAENMGFETTSTSKLLHQLTEELFKSIFNLGVDTYDKNICHIFDIGYRGVFNAITITSRDLLIKVAEECIVPVFGRETFANAAAKVINDKEEGLFIYEAFNRHECDLFLRALDKKDALIEVVTVRRLSEDVKCDTRNLLHGYYAYLAFDTVLENNDSLEDFKKIVSSFLSIVKQ